MGRASAETGLLRTPRGHTASGSRAEAVGLRALLRPQPREVLGPVVDDGLRRRVLERRTTGELPLAGKLADGQAGDSLAQLSGREQFGVRHAVSVAAKKAADRR